jgi:sugar (pentulose or hexulose) kinase
MPEVGARGAVVGALEITGRSPDTAAWTRPEAVIEPDPASAERYEDGFRRYREHRLAAQPFWRSA